MASAQGIQSLLRFLSQDAKVPLAQAMAKIKDLQKANLISPADIAKSDIERLKAIFEDDKVARQILNAAKRVSKKRMSTDSIPEPTPAKKAKPSYGQPLSPVQLEASLALPVAELDEEKLKDAVVFTNRAPLFLAFTVALLKYTMPEQPVSSRLSLAQAVVSTNAKTKATHIGLEKGKTAEEEGWGEGQPLVTVMNRSIRVMKRWGYTWEVKEEEGLTQSTMDSQPDPNDQPALWALDLDELRKSNLAPAPGLPGSRHTSTSQLPIYTAQSARAYLLKSIDTPKREDGNKKKKSNAAVVAEKERNVGLLLGALDLLYQSWASTLSKEDLDKRAWGWYSRCRPEVKAGAAGWGGKGNVKLSSILELRRPSG